MGLPEDAHAMALKGPKIPLGLFTYGSLVIAISLFMEIH